MASSPRSSPGRPLPLLWYGPLLEPTGFDEEGASVLLALEQEGFATCARNLRQPRGLAGTSDPRARGAIERALARPLPDGDYVFLQHALLQGRVHDRGPTAARLMFETDRLPPDWMRRLHVCDELWLTSEHARGVFAEAGVPEDRLHLLPMTLDFELYDPAATTPLELPAEAHGFRFLTTFEFQERKGWDVLLEAWVDAFSEDDDVSLVLKTFSLHGDTTDTVRARLDEALAAACAARGGRRPASVVLDHRILSATELPSLYAACDAFVLASRGEGWGRPYMEAMAMGLPTIGSRWSGNLAFMDDTNSFLVNGSLRPVQRWDARPERDWKGHRWFSADVDELSATLRRVAAGGAEVHEVAGKARRSLLERCNPTLVADRVAELTELALARHAERSTRPVACVWRGEFGLHHSLAISNLGTSRTLEDELARDGLRLERAAPDSLVDGAALDAVGVAQQWPPVWHPPARGAFVLFQPWELSRVPATWVERIDEVVDEIWVHSEHTRRAYLASGVEPERVHVVSAGVDLERFTPNGAPYPLPSPAGGSGRATCVFLWVGGLIPRKGLDRLLGAWAATFDPDDGVCLVVKAHQTGGLYRDAKTQQALERFAAQGDVAPVVILSEDIGPEELGSLYRASDCLVQPYRAEGFCLPPLEAMACGVPVIVTAGGPTDEFVDDTCGWLVPGVETVAPADWLPPALGTDPAAGPPSMLEPDHDALVSALRAATDPMARAPRAAAARGRAEQWTWARTGALAQARVSALAGMEPRRGLAENREQLADRTARAAIEDLVTAAHVDVATGVTQGTRAPTGTSTRPGQRGRKRSSQPTPRVTPPAVVTGGALERALGEATSRCDAETRYGLVRETLTRLVATAPALPAGRGAGCTLAAALELTRELERYGQEPVLLSELGVALFGLGEAAAAQELFTAVSRLDPEFPGVAGNLAAARGASGPGPLATDLGQRPVVRELADRAKAVARRVMPAGDRRISLCMIVRDEEAMLADCLHSADPWVDEIVVVDTGSTDRTVQIAESFGARVIHHPWAGSFAEARNVSLDEATGDVVLWLDADERLEPDCGPMVRALAAKTWRTAFYVEIENETGDAGRDVVVHEALRIWQHRPSIRFRGRLHEQQTGLPFELPDRFERTGVRIRHLGYRPEISKARGKGVRNRALLEGEREGPFTWFSLANELQAEHDHAGALTLFDRAWAALQLEREGGASAPHYKPVLALRRSRAARSAGDAAGAFARAEEGLEEFADHTELVLEAAVCARVLGALDEAAALARHALSLGEAPARYAPQIGSGTFMPLGLLATIHAELGRLVEARELLTALAERYPGEDVAHAAASSELAAWEAWYGTVAEVLENGSTVEPTPRQGSPLGRIGEVCVAVANGKSPGEVDARAVAALLEALLALQRFEAFERAIALWNAVELDSAERHERLARVYLRSGFLDSAHDEWAALWEMSGDARALAGISEVEAARGNHAAADELAGAAREVAARDSDAEIVITP